MISREHDPEDSLSVAVVLPAYNEADHIGEVIATMPEWVDRIYVVDDCSTDRTADVVRGLHDDRLTLISHQENTGVGGAMVSGYKRGLDDGIDILVKMDADGQMDPADMWWLCSPIADDLIDYSKGNRFYVVNSNRAMPAKRKFGSVMLSFMTKIASGYWHIFDSQCGFTAIRSGMLRLIDLDRISSDYFFENDMLIALNPVGARVADVPTATRYGDEVSDVSIARVAFTFPPRLFGRWWSRVVRKHFFLDFSAVGVLVLFAVPMILFGLIYGGYHWYLSAQYGEPATTGTVMIAVLPIIIGVQLALQAFVMEVGSSPGAAVTRGIVHSRIVQGKIR
jgi:glycosyltransferase involved in cell wall biosynthesis